MKTQIYDDVYDIARKNIKKYRKIMGLTQQQLADLTDLSHGYIRAVESQKVKESFSLDTLDRIANALNIDIKQLFDTIDD